ncbi:probable phosphoglycerate mutase [Pedococcus dokdonensis]|uniref:Probable phosphoglycerate mutase n=1 Tax=Pedococcus dokdonensis TaxID=443156 RepID=A0A1H0M9M3_9MICO|nr:histidine phosphatase family protein [Pedococcus dokdonensis]SDO76810.1 probable phosphoglycerate mutase [Pedococcus dokdonensis]
MSSARRVLIVRHGETDHNAGGVWQGQLDTPLSELGVEQARAAGRAIAAYRPSRVLASDLSRAAVTAQHVADAADAPLTLDPRWREIHVGQWQGLHTSEVREGYAELLAEMDRSDVRRGVDGETLAEVGRRAGESLREVLDGLGADECVVVVAHGVSSRAAVADLLGIDQHLATRALATMGNCHWVELSESRTGWQIRRWNVSA